MSNKYVVAYLSLFEGNMQIEFVEAETDVEAALDFFEDYRSSDKGVSSFFGRDR